MRRIFVEELWSCMVCSRLGKAVSNFHILLRKLGEMLILRGRLAWRRTASVLPRVVCVDAQASHSG